ncbi:Domain of uncharacterised function (DUF1877) [Kingella potus]|uniref:Domain of uncharacterized function (DUF1877) n=1 Tax=Kingella potus TaxID=265175 RepID=A0A377R042_9NEIS|nr:YfbM family protein [Kingella potus]UOP01339.1 YfbM family protein [Kingella potus]STR00350.1 Domain of uncharacterised function (DUF1877) [Kingella potus]
MGLCVVLQAYTEDDLNQILTGGSGFDALQEEENRAVAECDLDKLWDCLRYALTRSPEFEDTPLNNAVCGTHSVLEYVDLSPEECAELDPSEVPSYSTVGDVAEISAALNALDFAKQLGEISAAEWEKSDVYRSDLFGDDPEIVDFLIELFDELRAFYQTAAEQKCGVLSTLC